MRISHLPLYILVLMALPAFGQDKKVELINAGTLDRGMVNGQEIARLIGEVQFRQGDAFLYCDSAHQYRSINRLDAFGNVRFIRQDSLKLYGDLLIYDGDKQLIKVRGNVKLVNKSMVLTTPSIDYDLAKKTGYYFEGGKIVDEGNTLTSQIGYYYQNLNLVTFKQNVVVVSPEYRMETDTLHYQTDTKTVYFKGPTKLISEDGIMFAVDGDYNTETKQSHFRGRSRIESENYFLSGDILKYNQKTKIGFATGNVWLISKKDKVVVRGNKADYNGESGISVVYDSAWMENEVSGDTMFLSADTLVSIEVKGSEQRRLLAYNDVKIFKSDLQAVADSLVYELSDSSIYFFNDPVLWNIDNQMTADSIRIQMANNTIDRLFMRKSAFIISIDTLGNYNQVKGKDMTAWFDSGHIDRVLVDGNGQSIYYVLKEETKMVGMNYIECSNMLIRFANNTLSNITFLVKPDARLVPPREIEEPETRLKGFKWRSTDRPEKDEVTYGRYKLTP